MATISRDIDELIAQVASFEAGGRDFSAKVFIHSLNGILSGFEILRDNAEASAEVDEVLYRKVREIDTSRSLLRFATVNLLGMYLEAEARGTAGYLKSYQELVRSRSQDADTDSEFIERVLIPRLLRLRDLRNDAWLGKELVLRTAGFLDRNLAPQTFPPRPTRSDLERKPLAYLVLGFARRNLRAVGRVLTEDRNAIEYGLKRDKFFEGMVRRGQKEGLDVGPYLQQFRLLQPLSWWDRFVAGIRQLFGRIGAWFRKLFGWMPEGDVFWSGLLMLLALVVVLGVPIFWFLRYEHSVKEFRDDGMKVNASTLRVKRAAGEGSR